MTVTPHQHQLILDALDLAKLVLLQTADTHELKHPRAQVLQRLRDGASDMHDLAAQLAGRPVT